MPVSTPVLIPVIALVIWTMLIWLWMYVTRMPAVRKAGIVLDSDAPRGEQMSTLPPKVRWKADNYNHLMEQPTLFYAIALVLALLGQGEGLNLLLALAYVGLRIVHSLIQVLINNIKLRFMVFAVSSLVLIALTLRALSAAIS